LFGFDFLINNMQRNVHYDYFRG